MVRAVRDNEDRVQTLNRQQPHDSGQWCSTACADDLFELINHGDGIRIFETEHRKGHALQPIDIEGAHRGEQFLQPEARTTQYQDVAGFIDAQRAAVREERRQDFLDLRSRCVLQRYNLETESHVPSRRVAPDRGRARRGRCRIHRQHPVYTVIVDQGRTI